MSHHNKNLLYPNKDVSTYGKSNRRLESLSCHLNPITASQMTIKPSSEQFILTPLDHVNPQVFIPYSLAFEIQDQDAALETISEGIAHLTSSVSFLMGEVVTSIACPGTKTIMEVQQPPMLTSETHIPMLQVKYYTPDTLPVNRLGNKKFTLPASLTELFNPTSAFSVSGKPSPVVRFQANLVPNGIVLTMSFNHIVFDAVGAGAIVELLAESCRTTLGSAERESCFLGKMSEEIRLRKAVFSTITSSIGQASDSFNDGNDELPIATSPCHSSSASSSSSSSPLQSKTNSMPVVPSKHLRDECFVFSADRIDVLKATCNYLLPWIQKKYHQSPDEASLSFVSSNDVLTALICLLITKAKQLTKKNDHQKWKSYGCMMAVNLRRFFQPPFPESYTGNASVPLRFTVEEEDPSAFSAQQEILPSLLMPREHQKKLFSGLSIESVLAIAKTAYKIRSKLTGFEKDFPRHLASFINAHDDTNSVNVLPADVIVSSLRHLRTYELDFGPKLGRIKNFDTGVPWVDGNCVIMPASACSGPEAREEGAQKVFAPWIVRITLNEDTMSDFKKNAILCWALEKREQDGPHV